MYNTKIIRYFPLLACLIFALTACDSQTGAENSGNPDNSQADTKLQGEENKVVSKHTDKDDQVMASILEFKESETGIDPFVTRMMITDRYIRIDDAAEPDGFVLFDRLKKRIFSVVGENEMIVVVDPAKTELTTPDDLKLRTAKNKTDDAPVIAGVQPSYYQFYANDQLCYHVLAADGFYPEIANALRVFQSVLAAQQFEILESTPKDMRTPCFLANNIYAATEYMSKGFPLEQWDEKGYRRSLTGIEENVNVSKSMFAMPENYKYFSVGGGNVVR